MIFDCDGVLVDSEILCHQVLLQMVGEYGVTLSLEQALARFMGTSDATLVQSISAVIGRPVPEDFLARFGERTFAAFGESLAPVAGIETVLQTLQLPYCVASNGPREKMRFTLGHTGLLRHFEGRMFSAQDVQHPKPAPDLFLHAARTCGVVPARCIVVEDSATGVQAARAAGMTVLGYAAMGHAAKLMAAGAHDIFTSMASLLPTIERLYRPIDPDQDAAGD